MLSRRVPDQGRDTGLRKTQRLSLETDYNPEEIGRRSLHRSLTGVARDSGLQEAGRKSRGRLTAEPGAFQPTREGQMVGAPHCHSQGLCVLFLLFLGLGDEKEAAWGGEGLQEIEPLG